MPTSKTAEFFGFYNVFGRFATILGPLLMGFVSQAAKSSAAGIFSILFLFLLGGLFLTRVKQ